MTGMYVRRFVAPIRAVGLTADMAREEFSPRIGEMFDEVRAVIEPLGASLSVPIATYGPADDSRLMRVFVGYSYLADVPDGLVLVELPGTDAYCTVHVGTMETIYESWMRLIDMAMQQGYQPLAPNREIYLRDESPDQLDWIVELQAPVGPPTKS